MRHEARERRSAVAVNKTIARRAAHTAFADRYEGFVAGAVEGAELASVFDALNLRSGRIASDHGSVAQRPSSDPVQEEDVPAHAGAADDRAGERRELDRMDSVGREADEREETRSPALRR